MVDARVIDRATNQNCDANPAIFVLTAALAAKLPIRWTNKTLPDLPEAHLALGVFYYRGQRDFNSALKELDRAIELQPSNSEPEPETVYK